jgi:hypothetical protein
LIVTTDIPGIRQAALELLVESLREEDVERQLDSLREQDAAPEILAKLAPRRTLADAYYEYAAYILWLRGKRADGIDIEVLADEAEGLSTIEDALREYDRAHPCCPRCGFRQYSATTMLCRKCGLNFRKAG